MKTAGIFSKHTSVWKITVLLSILLLYLASPAIAEEIRVMTRNLYLGAEIQSLASAETPEAFLAGAQAALLKVAVNNFPERAQALASEIVEKKPHLVGLQEVYDFTINSLNGPPPFRDYLDDLLNALAAKGVIYNVAAVVKNLDIEIDVPGFGLVGVVDRDIILSRDDVLTQIISGLCAESRISKDGCTYATTASFVSPIGEIDFKRGFVAVDAVIGNISVTLFNTHLEVRHVDPTNPLSPFIQAAQSQELLAVLSPFVNSENLVLVVGDINSSPEHEVIDVGGWSIVPPYQQLLSAGLLDTWGLRPGKSKGFTCCQEEILLNAESMLSERIDVIFTNKFPTGKVQSNVVGNDEEDKTPSGLWPSDHAGVVTRMKFDPK